MFPPCLPAPPYLCPPAPRAGGGAPSPGMLATRPLAGRAGAEPAVNPWDSSRGRPLLGVPAPAPIKWHVLHPPVPGPSSWGCAGLAGNQCAAGVRAATGDAAAAGDGSDAGDVADAGDGGDTGDAGTAVGTARCWARGVVWAAPGRRGALLAGFIVLIAGKAGGPGHGGAGSRPRAAPDTGGAGVEASTLQPQRQAVPAGSTGSQLARQAQPQRSSRVARKEPGAPRRGSSLCEGQHGVAAGWRQRDGGYGCLGQRWGLLRDRLRGRPRREEGAEARPSPWRDLPASSRREEPGRGAASAWLCPPS